MQRVVVEKVIEAPLEDVFARYTDHVGWSSWAGAGRISLAREGSPDKNGVGCVRAFDSAMGLQEEVTAFEPPHHMSYRIVQGGFPVKNHRGDVRFEPHGQGTRITWTCEFGSRIPLTEWAIGRFIKRVFGTFLSRFEKHALRG